MASCQNRCEINWAKQHCNHVRARAPYRSCAAAEQTRMTRPAGDGEERALGRCQPEFLNAEMIRQEGNAVEAISGCFARHGAVDRGQRASPRLRRRGRLRRRRRRQWGPLPLQRWPVESSSPTEEASSIGASLDTAHSDNWAAYWALKPIRRGSSPSPGRIPPLVSYPTAATTSRGGR